MPDSYPLELRVRSGSCPRGGRGHLPGDCQALQHGSGEVDVDVRPGASLGALAPDPSGAVSIRDHEEVGTLRGSTVKIAS